MKKKINIVYLWEILTENNKYLIEELIKKNCNVTVISRNKQKKKFFFYQKLDQKILKFFYLKNFIFLVF